MTRIFDAMQEAARRRSANGAPQEAVWTELGITGAAVQKAKKISNSDSGLSQAVETLVGDDVPESHSKIRDLDDVRLGAGPLRGTPAKLFLDKSARLFPNSKDPVVTERYRMLRTKILQERDKKLFRSLLVTSPSPQEGKTVTVLNLALSFAALPSFKIVVIDGDTRKGTLGSWFGLDKEQPGLSNLIEGTAQLEDVLLSSEELSLHVISRGTAQVCDLQPFQLDGHFRRLAKEFDLVLIDTPPVNLITDVQIFAESCDAVLLIARAFSTTTKSIEEAATKLHSFRIIGTVLNAGTPLRTKYQGYY